MSDSDRSADCAVEEEIAAALSIIIREAEFFWKLIGDDPMYKGVTPSERIRLTEASYNRMLRPSIGHLAEANKADVAVWASLHVWKFVTQFAALLRQHANEHLSWETSWIGISNSIQQWQPEPNFDLMGREIQGTLKLLMGKGRGVLPPASLSIVDTIKAATSAVTDSTRPKWNRATRQLTIGNHPVTIATREAPVLFKILDALENAKWPADGVPAPKPGSVKDAVDLLNNKLSSTRLRILKLSGNKRIGWTWTQL